MCIQTGRSDEVDLHSSLADTQTCTYCRLPRPGAARFNMDRAEAASKISSGFVALGDHRGSFKGRGWFGGGVALYVMKMRRMNKTQQKQSSTDSDDEIKGTE